MNGKGRCPECCVGGLVPAPGCTCNENAHTCTPVICIVCGGSGRARCVPDRSGKPGVMNAGTAAV